MIFEFFNGLEPMFADFGITAALVSAAVMAAASAAVAAASKTNIKAPDVGAASKAGVEADIATLPGRRAVEQAARLGTATTYPTGRTTTTYTYEQLVGGGGLGGPEVWKTVTSTEPPKTKGLGAVQVRNVQTSTTPEMATADFTGTGDIDLAKIQAEAAAKLGMDISKKYSSQFIDQARAEERLADPEGWAARQLQNELINQQGAEAGQVNPVATRLDEQLANELERGAGLSQRTKHEIAGAADTREAVGDPTRRRTLYAELEQGTAGLSRAEAARRKMLSELTSGQTPEDITYRKGQQVLSNRMAFAGGASPVTQFNQLAGAQQGAAPVYQAPPAVNASPTSNTAAMGFQTNAYGQQVRNLSQNASPWFAGLSTALKGATAVAAGMNDNTKTP